MSNEVNYSNPWSDEATQCKNCRNFQNEDGRNACVPEGESFLSAIEKYGEVDETGHCNFFMPKS